MHTYILHTYVHTYMNLLIRNYYLPSTSRFVIVCFVFFTGKYSKDWRQISKKARLQEQQSAASGFKVLACPYSYLQRTFPCLKLCPCQMMYAIRCRPGSQLVVFSETCLFKSITVKVRLYLPSFSISSLSLLFLSGFRSLARSITLSLLR